MHRMMVIIGFPNESNPGNALADMSPTHQKKQHCRNRPTRRPTHDQRICQHTAIYHENESEYFPHSVYIYIGQKSSEA